jgi:two-component system, NarL family, response regulator DesR
MTDIRTILADDAPLVRGTIAQLLALEPDIEVLGEYANGCTALAAVHELRPDVAVLDVDMPGLDGIAVAEAVAHTETRVLILSSITASDTFHAAMRAGVDGYVVKTAPPDRLAAAVRAVAAGIRFVDVDLDLADEPAGSAPAPLTARERRVLRAVSLGRSTKEICETAGLSQEIVGIVMCTVLAKTGGRDRLAAAAIAGHRGWI